MEEFDEDKVGFIEFCCTESDDMEAIFNKLLVWLRYDVLPFKDEGLLDALPFKRFKITLEDKEFICVEGVFGLERPYKKPRNLVSSMVSSKKVCRILKKVLLVNKLSLPAWCCGPTRSTYFYNLKNLCIIYKKKW